MLNKSKLGSFLKKDFITILFDILRATLIQTPEKLSSTKTFAHLKTHEFCMEYQQPEKTSDFSNYSTLSNGTCTAKTGHQSHFNSA